MLAAAARDVDADTHDLTQKDLEQDMVFLGLVSIVDPPRPEAIEAIRLCRQAGIRVKLVTMLQLAADMPVGGAAPPGYGHRFAAEHYIDAWLALTEPKGWTEADVRRLKALSAGIQGEQDGRQQERVH